ncbi:MAG: DNA cytosine methyltransferase [Parcubacteria group bacterium]|jgi:DNA (cytosine-5)-methyltransferase 1
MKHLDLFSGIGGFALAIDTVWPNSEHIFCDNDKFCQQVLKKHWPNSKIYEDIREITRQGITSDTDWGRHIHGQSKKQSAKVYDKAQRESVAGIQSSSLCDIITGGFPCQPFSAAGKRRGTEDNRHLWPEMFRVIQLAKPTWVIAENVRGLLTIGGLVFEQVCLDLESADYEVQPFIIPAVGVNAPHRRDRIWFVAHRKNERGGGRASQECGNEERKLESSECQGREVRSESQRCAGQPNDTDTTSNGQQRKREAIKIEKGHATRPEQIRKLEGRFERPYSDATDSESEGGKCRERRERRELAQLQEKLLGWNCAREWDKNWLEVATELCGVDDGLPVELDGFKLSKAGHRTQRLKSLGNAIVPQVAIQIMKAIKQHEQQSADN